MYRAIFTTIFPLVLAGICWGQRGAEISGNLTDASDSVVAGARVTVVNVDTGTERQTVSNALGYYSVPLLTPGSYNVTVEREGFQTVNRSGITLAVDQAARIDFVLQVGSLAEKVLVTADATVVETQTATLKGVVDEYRIRELPLNGRDPNQLIFLMPGVYATTDTSGLTQVGSGRGIVQPGVSSNGGRGNTVNYALDGAYHNDHFTNVSLPVPDPDALQEFSVQTNGFSAEFGRNAGGVVNAVTKSGTNTVHGTLFEFHRNAAANARNYFATSKDSLKRHQFGGTLGGPVFIPRVYNGKERTFFFMSFQQTLQVQRPSDASTTVLTPAQRAGNFSARSAATIDPLTNQPFAGNQIPLSRLNPVTKNLLDNLIPLPTNPATGLLQYVVPANNDSRQTVLKIDHNFNSRNMLTARYLRTFYHQPGNDTDLVFASTVNVESPNNNASAGYTHIFSPTTVNLLQLSFIRRRDFRRGLWSRSFKDFGVRNIAVDTSIPAKELLLSVTGAFSFDVGETDDTTLGAVVIGDVFRRTMGRHETSFGVEFRRDTLDLFFHFLIDPQIQFNGNITGYGVADFFLGTVGRMVQSASGQRAELSRNTWSAFAQDNINVSRRFKLNLGIRFEPYTPWIDSKNRVVAFRQGQKSTVYPNAPVGLVYPGDPGVPHGGVNPAIWNFAPRIGFAWSPFGAKTSIRGAYGIFLDSSMMSAIANRFENSPPHGMRVTLVPPPGPFEDPYVGASPFPIPIPPPRDIQFPNGLVAITYPPDFKVAYLQSWNFTVEHELRRNLLARLSYAGSKGTKLLQGVELNGGVYIPGRSTAANLASRQPYAPALTTLTSLCFCGNSMFSSLQATLEKRFSGGFSVLANYTLGRSIDYGSGGGTLWPSYANPNDFRLSRGLSDFFHKHRFVTSWIWELPHLNRQDRITRAILGGWNLNGIFAYQTGAPFTVTSGQDNSFSGLGTDRADLVGDWRIDNPGPGAWFNTRAFAANAIGTFGNTGRNLLIGPNLTSLDLSLVKDFVLRERLKLQFRAEAFNLPNHANFNQPASSRTSATFGQITGSAAARVMQFAMKLRW